MDAEKEDKFMKNLISQETKHAITALKNIIEDKNYIEEEGDENLKCLVTLCLQPPKDQMRNYVSRQDIISIIKHVLRYKLDFSHRLDGKRDILKQWQKTRASKDEELSVKLREKGNDYLRIGQLQKALCLYNEALLYGNLNIIKMTTYTI